MTIKQTCIDDEWLGEYDTPLLTALRMYTVDVKRFYAADALKGRIRPANTHSASSMNGG